MLSVFLPELHDSANASEKYLPGDGVKAEHQGCSIRPVADRRASFVMATSDLAFPPPIEVTLSLLYKPD